MQFLSSPSHNAYVADPAISTSNAKKFGVKFMAHLFSADLGSPVVAYNKALGKAIVYAGDERGDLYAVDGDTGRLIWSTNFGVGDSLLDTPAVAPDGTVWVGTQYDAYLYKLNGATGKVLCSIQSPNAHPVMGSPMIVTPPGGSLTVFWDAIDSGVQGPLVSTNEATCAQNWGLQVVAGAWTTPSFAVDGAGESLILNGTADPGCQEIAYDAITGNTVWTDFLALRNPCTADVGNASSISPPGNNGFADGVAYVADDDGDEFALDLNTGAHIWEYYSYPTNFEGKRYQIATMALDGNTLVYGYYNGVNALNATTGALRWADTAIAGVDSSPAIIGPAGSEVVAYADVSGLFHLVSLSSGSQLYTYQTGSYIVGSAAEYNGTIYITSGDGFLYAFAPNGGNGSKPAETVASPANGATVPNPNGAVGLTGTATDANSVTAVEIAIQSGGSSGPWYDAATNTWNSAPVRNQASLASPGAASTNWSFSLPVPAAGNNYEVFANAVNSSNLVDPGSYAYFSVSPSKNEPVLKTSDFDVPPAGTFNASGNAFKPGETVTFTLLGSTAATATVGKTGNVPQTAIAVPSSAPFGPTSLTATGGSSGKSASVQIYVSNAWTQAGYSGLRSAQEPHDYVINHTIFAGESVLNPQWVYPSGAAINTTPAIEDGIAYFGNDAGTLSAVTVSSGALAWSYTVPSGQPIRSSPAIDGSGQLIFGGNDGNLYVLSSSGQPVKTISLTGTLDAPAYANGNIVIGSSTGQIYSISDPAWTTNWSVNAGSAPSVAPAYDGQDGVVIVGTSNGSVIGYSSATGAVLWTATTGGVINGIAIANKQVFAGSGDGYVYAFDERAGTLKWKITGDGSAVTALDANGGGPAFGTTKGNMYEANASGSIYYSKEYTANPIVGLGGAGTDEFGSNTIGDLELLRSADGGWLYTSGSKYSVGPVLLDGVLFQGTLGGNFVAFTTTGYTISPQASIRVGGAVVNIDGSTNCSP